MSTAHPGPRGGRARSRATALLGFTALASIGLAQPAWSGTISYVDMFRSGFATQTGDGNTLAPDGYRFDTHLFSGAPNDFTAVQLSYPGAGSPVDLAQDPTNPATWAYTAPPSGPLFADQAALDAAFPFGTYTYDATGSPSQSTSFDFTANDYPSAQPFLTGNDFSALQGINAAAPFTLHFNGFAPDAAASAQYVFVTVFDDATNQFVVNDAFLPQDTTSVNVAANTLTPDTPYRYEIIYSNRVLLPSPNAQFDAQLGFDLRTSGAFRTAAAVASVPEPGALALALAGMVALLGVRRVTHRMA